MTTFCEESNVPVEECVGCAARRFVETGARVTGERSVYGLLAKHGRDFEAKQHELPLGRIGECYRNAGTVAIGSERYVYVEGYAVSVTTPLPMAHAWLLDTTDGRAVDATWEPGRSYYGIPFSGDWLRAMLQRTRVWGVMEPFARDVLGEGGDPAEAIYGEELER